jgi:HD-GYP domain-containing protein (c-di-GMP phosphodiesterase class II)
MKNMSLKEFVLPLIKSMDSFNYLLKSHHRRTAVIAFAIGKKMNLSSKELADLVIAASIHDIGALSIQDRDRLLEEDVSDPKPHCNMAFKILEACDVFSDIGKILLHHHIIYEEVYMYSEEIKIQSHIIHLADRVEIYISQDEFILDQKEEVRNKIRDRKGTILNPKVCKVFEDISQSNDFWLNINNMTLDNLFMNIEHGLMIPLTHDIITGFSTVMSRIVDYRSHFTTAHSFTVGNLAKYIGDLLNKDEDYKIQLLVAGLLHDVGKFGINPSLISKEGKLSDDEYSQLKLIPYYSNKILNELAYSPWFEDVVKWIATYQEESDSAVNNDKYVNELGAKIIGLSNIITALMEDRPNRESYSIDKALEIIREYEADKVDNSLFDIITQHQSEIGNIVQMYQNEGNKYYDDIEKEFDY